MINLAKLVSFFRSGGKISRFPPLLNRRVFKFLAICYALSAGCLLFSDYQLKIWQDQDVRFHFHERDEKIVRTISPLVKSDIDHFHKSIGFSPRIETKIVIAPDEDYYRNLMTDFQGIIEFSQAFYSPAEQMIYIRSLRSLKDFQTIRKILLHEYIHLFIDEVFYNAPLWFHEGMAVFFSYDLTYDKELLYAKDFVFGNTQTIIEMSENYPTGYMRWNPFYTKSALAVKYLYSGYRNEFFDLWQYHEDKVNFHQAFVNAFKMTIPQFSHLLEEHLSKRFRIEIIFAFSSLLWGFLPLILLAGWVRKKIVNRQIKQRWERDYLSASNHVMESSKPELPEIPHRLGE